MASGERSRYDDDLRRREAENNSLRLLMQRLEEDNTKLNAERSALAEYEHKVRQLMEEIDRLNNRLRYEIN